MPYNSDPMNLSAGTQVGTSIRPTMSDEQRRALALLRQFVDVPPGDGQGVPRRIAIEGADHALTTDEQEAIRQNYGKDLPMAPANIASARNDVTGEVAAKYIGQKPSATYRYEQVAPVLNRSAEDISYNRDFTHKKGEQQFLTDEQIRLSSGLPSGKKALAEAALAELRNKASQEAFDQGGDLRAAERAADMAEAQARGKVAPLAVDKVQSDIAASTAAAKLAKMQADTAALDLADHETPKQKRQYDFASQAAQNRFARGQRAQGIETLGKIPALKGMDLEGLAPVADIASVFAPGTKESILLEDAIKNNSRGFLGFGNSSLTSEEVQRIIDSAVSKGVPEDEARLFVWDSIKKRRMPK